MPASCDLVHAVRSRLTGETPKEAERAIHDGPAVAHPLLGVPERMKTSTAVALSLGLLLGPPSAAIAPRAAAARRPRAPYRATAPGDHRGSRRPACPPRPATRLVAAPLAAPSAPPASGPPCRLGGTQRRGRRGRRDRRAARLLRARARGRSGRRALPRRHRQARIGLDPVGRPRGRNLRQHRRHARDAPRIDRGSSRRGSQDRGAIVHGTVIEDVEAPPAAAPPVPRHCGRAATASAKVHFALGLVGQFPPLDRSATPAAGADPRAARRAGAFEIVTDIRFGGDDSDASVGITSSSSRWAAATSRATPTSARSSAADSPGATST